MNFSKKVNVLIPAAGASERIFPFSKDVSKLLLRVNNKCVIDLIIKEIRRLFKSYDININIICKKDSLEVESYCRKYYEDIRIHYIEKSNNPLETIKFGLSKIEGDQPLLIWLSDSLIKNSQELDLRKNFICVKDLQDQHKWCIHKNGTYYDKPSSTIKDGKALIGIYGFSNTNQVKNCIRNLDQSCSEISHILANFSMSEICVDSFFNFGDLGDYYKSSSNLLKFNLRPNNFLKKDDDLPIIKKSSTNSSKIKNEYLWYKRIKGILKINIPTIIEFKKNELTMTYEHGYLLSDLFIENEFKEPLCNYLLKSLLDLIFDNFYKKNKSISNYYNSYVMWVFKTKQRLKTLDFFTSKEKSKLINISKALYKNSKSVKLIHGDLHLGNIIFDFNKNKFVFLDPRGSFGLSKSSGDIQYDLCKLYHSLPYMYISNGLQIDFSKIKKIEEILDSLISDHLRKRSLDLELIKRGSLLLICTCIDYHPKNRDLFISYCKSELTKI